MILVGLQTEWMNCVGTSSTRYFLEEYSDIHEAAVAVLKSTWSTSFQCQRFKHGEFHDTQTRKTWTVDAGGHTQKDYRSEGTVSFNKRWTEKIDGRRNHEGKSVF